MEFTRLSQPMVDILQKQTKHELSNFHFYLGLNKFCRDKSYNGGEKLFYKQALGELDHFNIFADYMVDKKACPVIPAVDVVNAKKITDIVECLNLALQREKQTTAYIKEVCKLALEEADYQTYELGLKMMNEQVEEETLYINLLDRYEILKNCSGGLFLLDQEIFEKYK